MPLAGWLTALAVGALAGVVSGLIGIGGGAVMVPFLYFFMAEPGLAGRFGSPETQAVLAHATSLLVIVPVSLRGALLYHRERLVDWSAVRRMGLASILGALIGARVAVLVPGALLKLIFGIFLLVVATGLAIGKQEPERDVPDAHPGGHTVRALLGGLAVGFFSALLGVGGGLVAIPVLVYWLHLPIRRVSGSSLALITFTALVGVGAYALNGALAAGAPSGVVSLFHLPAGLALAGGALLAVPLGTTLQLRIPAHALRRLFAVVFLLLGARIVIGNLLDVFGG